jgi:hypothetical protein
MAAMAFPDGTTGGATPATCRFVSTDTYNDVRRVRGTRNTKWNGRLLPWEQADRKDG